MSKQHLQNNPANILAHVTTGTLLGLFALLLSGLVVLSLGFFPLLGHTSVDIWPWQGWLDQPQLWWSTLQTGGIALLATAISVVLSMAMLALKMTFDTGQPGRQGIRRQGFSLSTLTPLLAVPHPLLAMAVTILLSPTGWWARGLAMVLGLDRPQDYLFAPDPWGLTLLLVLVIKETAFLLLMATAALSPVNAQPLLMLGRSFGYRRFTGWVKIMLPIVYPRLRLPIMAVLVYSASTVELPMLTNSHNAPTLSMLILRAAHHHDLDQWLVASAGAVYLLVVAMGLMAIWIGLERLVARLSHGWVISGSRGTIWGEWLTQKTIHLLTGLLLGIGALGLLGLFITATSWRWVFPDIWPQIWRWQHTKGMSELGQLWVTADFAIATALAATVSAVAIVLSLLLLEASPRLRLRLGLVMYLPLVIPVIASVLGLQMLLYSLSLGGGVIAAMIGHLLFVLPYVYFSLSGSVEALDRRYLDIARTLGYGFWRSRLRLWWPLLLRPVLVALALGMAVSMAQYVPTLLLSGGRFNTPMQLFVQMSAGGNMRQIASVGLALLLVIALPFWLSVVIPAWRYRHRCAMLPEQH